jgi:hypothetical protein
MAINPSDITTVRVDQLSPEAITLASLLPHQVGTDLKQDTVQALVDLVATAIGAGSGVGYLPISVTDGQQLPAAPADPSFFLCGAGTFLNINGFPNVICTGELNAVMSLTDHWELAVEIPIVAEVGVQTVTGSAVDNTDPLNPVINLTSSIPTLQEVLDNNHDLVDNNNFQGTEAGEDNTGTDVNAFGFRAALSNTGTDVNAFGQYAAKNNTAQDVNAFGQQSAQNNTGTSINAFGISSAEDNTGNDVNAFGSESAKNNTGDYVNSFGWRAGFSNTFKNVNLFGYNATADADNQTVFSKWVSGVTKYLGRLSFNNITADRKWELPDANGTIALLSDITGGGFTVISTNTTANNDTNYSVVANATFTDPTPVEGKGYIVFVRNGTATIGGVGYTAGILIYRVFHSGSWSSTVYVDKDYVDTALALRKKVIVRDVTSATVTGTTSLTLAKTYEVTAGTLSASGFLDLFMYASRTSASNSYTMGIYINTTNNFGTATLITSIATSGNFSPFLPFKAQYVLKNNLLIGGISNQTSGSNYVNSITQVSIACNNTSNSVWLFIGITPTNSGSSIVVEGVEILN